MSFVLFQNDIWSNLGLILWFGLSFIMVFIYPKLMFTQIMWRFQQSVELISQLSANAKKILFKKISKYTKKDVREPVNNFMEFFIIEPISLDPFGIMRKIEHLSTQGE